VLEAGHSFVRKAVVAAERESRRHPSDRAARARIATAMDGYETGELRSFRGRGGA
jgi:hypothetical protein